MVRANIYSINPLLPEVRGAIHDGAGMVIAYMGEVLAVQEKLVRLPMKDNGTVNPRRVGFGNFDKMIELHLLAVPLDPGESERLGYAGVARGWSYVDTASRCPELIRTTAAHELAHALGFVLRGSQQEDPGSPHHCYNGNCIMHRKVMTETFQEEVRLETVRRKRLSNLLQKRRVPSESNDTMPQPRVRMAQDQYDFCLPCKIDLRDSGNKQLRKLRNDRLFTWRGVI